MHETPAEPRAWRLSRGPPLHPHPHPARGSPQGIPTDGVSLRLAPTPIVTTEPRGCERIKRIRENDLKKEHKNLVVVPPCARTAGAPRGGVRGQFAYSLWAEPAGCGPGGDECRGKQCKDAGGDPPEREAPRSTPPCCRTLGWGMSS